MGQSNTITPIKKISSKRYNPNYEKNKQTGKTVGGAAGSTVGSVLGAIGGTLAAPFTAGLINPVNGAALGSTVGGEIGKGAGAQVGKLTTKKNKLNKQQLLGAGEIAASGIANENAKKSMPDYVDSQEQKLNTELDAMRKGIYTGAGYSEALRQLNKQQAAANNATISASGGAGGQAIAGEALNLSATGDEYGKIYSGDQAAKLQYSKDYNDSTNSMIGRRADLDVTKWGQDLENAKNLLQAGGTNFLDSLINSDLPKEDVVKPGSAGLKGGGSQSSTLIKLPTKPIPQLEQVQSDSPENIPSNVPVHTSPWTPTKQNISKIPTKKIPTLNSSRSSLIKTVSVPQL